MISKLNMTDEREETRKNIAAVCRLAQSAIGRAMEAAFERKAEIVKMDFSKIIGSRTVASNLCCNGF